MISVIRYTLNQRGGSLITRQGQLFFLREECCKKPAIQTIFLNFLQFGLPTHSTWASSWVRTVNVELAVRRSMSISTTTIKFLPESHVPKIVDGFPRSRDSSVVNSCSGCVDSILDDRVSVVVFLFLSCRASLRVCNAQLVELAVKVVPVFLATLHRVDRLQDVFVHVQLRYRRLRSWCRRFCNAVILLRCRVLHCDRLLNSVGTHRASFRGGGVTPHSLQSQPSCPPSLCPRRPCFASFPSLCRSGSDPGVPFLLVLR